MSITKPSLTVLAWGAAVLVALAALMIFVIAPEDADQGFSQKIFYVHVPIALTAYACFGLGAWKAYRLLATRGERYDLDLKAFSAIGYREARACLRGAIASTDLGTAIARSTRAYAKRQRVWLRGQMSTLEVAPTDVPRAVDLASAFFE